MAWFRPEEETEYNTPDRIRSKIDESRFDSFMDQFIDNKKKSVFSENEREAVKDLVTQPLIFSTGYPLNVSDKPEVGTVYITEADFSEESHFIGSTRLEGKAFSSIVVVGSTAGKNLNMAEPSIILDMIYSLLWGARNYFTAHHLEEAKLNKTNYAQDESNSHEMRYAMRSLTMTYKAEMFIPITNYGVLEDG